MLRLGPAGDKTGDITIILSAHMSLLLDFKCHFPTFGLLLCICGLYNIVIIIIVIIIHGVSMYFT